MKETGWLRRKQFFDVASDMIYEHLLYIVTPGHSTHSMLLHPLHRPHAPTTLLPTLFSFSYCFASPPSPLSRGIRPTRPPFSAVYPPTNRLAHSNPHPLHPLLRASTQGATTRGSSALSPQACTLYRRVFTSEVTARVGAEA